MGLSADNLDPRLAEGLPWLLLRFEGFNSEELVARAIHRRGKRAAERPTERGHTAADGESHTERPQDRAITGREAKGPGQRPAPPAAADGTRRSQPHHEADLGELPSRVVQHAGRRADAG